MCELQHLDLSYASKLPGISDHLNEINFWDILYFIYHCDYYPFTVFTKHHPILCFIHTFDILNIYVLITYPLYLCMVPPGIVQWSANVLGFVWRPQTGSYISLSCQIWLGRDEQFCYGNLLQIPFTFANNFVLWPAAMLLVCRKFHPQFHLSIKSTIQNKGSHLCFVVYNNLEMVSI